MSVEFQNSDVNPWKQYEWKDSRKKNSLHYLGIQQKQILKNAEDEGLVNVLSEKTIINHSKNNFDKCPSYAGDARIVYLSKFRLKDICLIDICERLEICVLSNNFIQDISPLKWCINIKYLDVHSNLISNLPKKAFWSCFSKLVTLYLHDNGLSKLEELRSLACCPSIINLTIYDTPLSLKKTYRHCVVNAVWSLKALDYYIISDEEIIEDASFPLKFKPLQNHFKFVPIPLSNPKKASCPHLKKARTLFNKELEQINRIQAKFSPVLLIQKCIRGYLVRLRYHYLLDTRLWAAVSIQRFYRNVKGYPNPPPTSPNLFHGDNTTTLMNRLSSMKLDYETYLKMRRSLHKSSISMKSSGKSVAFRLSKNTGGRQYRDNPIHKHINVDLEFLEGRTEHFYLKEKDNTTKQISPLKLPSTHSSVATETQVVNEPVQDIRNMAQEFGINLSNWKKPKSKIGKYFTQYEFLGEISTEKTFDAAENSDVNFRLTIRRPEEMTRDPVEEMIIRTIEGAEDIRKTIKEIEHKRKFASPPQIKREKPPMNADEKLYMKTQGSMPLSCFHAVKRAYSDRKKAEDLLRRADFCQKERKSEKIARNKVEVFKKSYQTKALVKKQDDRASILEALALRRQESETCLANYVEKRETERSRHKTKLEQFEFAKQFNCQNNSIGKTLVSHDRIARSDEINRAKIKIVDRLKLDDKHQREVVRDFLEQTKMVRQAERMNLRGDIDLLLTKNNSVRKQELAELLNKRKEIDRIKLLSPSVLEPKELRPDINENDINI